MKEELPKLRVQLTRVFSADVWTFGQASLQGSRQAPQVQDETVAGLGSRGCAMKLVSLAAEVSL